MTKLNPQTMKNQYDHQYDTFCRKNHDYGNSFEESLDQFGIVASIVRMSDKMKRLESLTDESKTQQVGSESLLDTLEDLSNYATMTACWLRGIREEDGEPDELSIYADNKSVISVNSLNEVVKLLKKSLEFNYKIEWARMSEDDCVELKNVIDRLSTMVTDGSISEELMLRLIKHHVKFNPESTIHRVFNQVKDSKETPSRPMEIPEAVKQLWETQKQQVNHLFAANNDKEDEKVDLFNAEFLNMAKTCLNELFDNIILCRDQNIPLPKRLTYCSYREEKYEQIAALVLTGNIDFGEVSRIVNDYPNLRVAEKNHLLQSIVSAAYKISDEPENEKPEFLNKKFHIPDEILEDLKEPEEEPERKRTVLGMIFPFRL